MTVRLKDAIVKIYRIVYNEASPTNKAGYTVQLTIDTYDGLRFFASLDSLQNDRMIKEYFSLSEGQFQALLH
jgi:hypothetical protein